MTSHDPIYVLVDWTGKPLTLVAHADDFSDVEAEPRDRVETYRVFEVTDTKLHSERQFGPYVVGLEEPTTRLIQAGNLKPGHWVQIGNRFREVTSVVPYGFGQVDVYLACDGSDVGGTHDESALFTVATDADWAKNWRTT